MPRTALVPQQITRSGLTPAYTAANAAGHSVDNGGPTIIHVKTGGTGVTVTVHEPALIDGQAIADRSIVIGTSSERMLGPWPPDIYNQPDGTGVSIDFSQVTSVTIAALRL